MAAATTTVVHRPRTLVSAWLFLSSFVVAWDVGYILLRPRSMFGGDLHWLWSPYSLYMNVDYIYGLPSWDTKDGFPAAQSLMNVGESIINLFYIYLVHVKATQASLAVAPIWGLIAVIMTLSKTILYVLNDYCCGWCKTGHNDWYTLFVYWILPNGLWILFPSIIAYVFVQEISTTLKVAAGVQVNVHTHLWGAVFSIVLSTSHLLQHLNLLPSWVRPFSHHPIFYPSSLTFTTVTGKVLRLASASYPGFANQLISQRPLTTTSQSLIGKALSLLSSTSASSSSFSIPSKLTNLAVRSPDTLDVAGFAAFFIGSVICLGFSSTYHAIQCHSQSISKKFNKLDYVGIVVMIVGSFLPALHYGFYCHPHYQLAYSLAISSLGTLAMYVVLAPTYATPAYRPYRTAVFLVLGLSAVVPVAHVVNLYGYRTITETMGLRFLILSGALYVIGACLYAARVPERFAPGKFDMVGASHQIFHVLILAAAAAHYISIRRAYAFWHTVEVIGSEGGKAGVCAALQG
uniref:Related to Adiponectin receptor 1 n=1 Tax=Melanopsichium pennsylvanicum 4 TaxID=1398559 RepID=A0A077R692_9BASI|nr:related to Adiponectin receptor 1 [Melanopsichium pennsylvanicum 4]